MLKNCLPVLTFAAVIGIGACGDQAGGRPADMGAGRPDTMEYGTAAETPAPEVMEGMGVGATPRPGATPIDTAQVRDTAVIDATGRIDG
jgi:hypothetical protein